MAENTPRDTVERRGLFAKIGLAGAAAVVTAVAGRSEPAEAFTPSAEKGGAHYRESAHVKQYYRVNRY